MRSLEFQATTQTQLFFCKNKAYRIEGTFDELGNGGMFPVEFSETIGCLNHNSIVQTKIGVFFAGNDGFYWTDAYQVKKISESLLTTYFNATETQIQKDRVFGTYDRDNNKVLWAMTQATAQVDNNIIFCCDLRWGIRENSVFTTWTGSTSFAPTALCYHNKLLRRADRRGYLLYHSDKLLTDPKIDEALLPSLWTKQTIFYDYRSTQMNFGLPQIRKWVQRILISLKNVSNVSLKTYSHNDDSNKFVPLTEVKNTTQPIWGDPLLIWGEDTPLWNFYELIEEERRFPAGTLRSSYKQIKFTNSYTVIEKSDDLGLATVNNVAKTATLVTSGNTWVADARDYYISFEHDDYAEQYLIIARTDTIITYKDLLNTSPTGNKKWQIAGYSKGETMHLLAYVLYFIPFTKSFTVGTGSTGGNAS
jgi:hypothetical protein